MRTIPRVGEASTSRDQRPRRPRQLLANVRRLLQHLSQLPLLGVSHQGFHAAFDELRAAHGELRIAFDEADTAMQQLSVLLDHQRVPGNAATFIDDIIAEFF